MTQFILNFLLAIAVAWLKPQIHKNILSKVEIGSKVSINFKNKVLTKSSAVRRIGGYRLNI